MAPDSPLVKALTDVYVRCTGLDGTPICIGGGTYAKSIPNVLAFGTTFPGEVTRVHKSDESISIDNLMRNAEIIAEAMYALAQ
jgi:succinyl-diaminopimelate desuccinylase